MQFKIYNLKDFLEYPEFAFKFAFYEPFIWSGNRHRHQPSLWLRIKILIHVFGIIAPILQIMALFINLFIPFNKPEDEAFENMESRVFEATALSCYFCCGIYKMLNILWRRNDIGCLMEEFAQLFPNAIKQTMQAEANNYKDKLELKRGSNAYYHLAFYKEKSHTLMYRLTCYLSFAYFYYNIVPIIQLAYEFFSPNVEIMYKTQANVWYPWHNHNNHSTFIGFFFTFLLQAFSEFSAVAFFMSGLYLFIFFTIQLELHFDYLANAMEALDARSPDAERKLKTLISYHYHLIRLFKQVNSIFNITFTLDLINATFAISLMGIAMVMMDFGGAVMFSAGFSFFLVVSYIFSKSGDELTCESRKLSAAIFNSNWYEGTPQYRRMIIFFIMYTKDPIKYQAYGYTELSMETYMKILKLSYQLFTALRATE